GCDLRVLLYRLLHAGICALDPYSDDVTHCPGSVSADLLRGFDRSPHSRPQGPGRPPDRPGPEQRRIRSTNGRTHLLRDLDLDPLGLRRFGLRQHELENTVLVARPDLRDVDCRRESEGTGECAAEAL